MHRTRTGIPIGYISVWVGTDAAPRQPPAGTAVSRPGCPRCPDTAVNPRKEHLDFDADPHVFGATPTTLVMKADVGSSANSTIATT